MSENNGGTKVNLYNDTASLNNSTNSKNKNKLDRLKRMVDEAVSIMDIIDDYGYSKQRVGADFRIRCPFHQGDRNASMSINPKSQVYNCFACGEKGRGAVDFVAAHEKLRDPDFSTTDAILYIVNKFDVNINSIDVEELKAAEQQEKYTVDGEQYNNDKISVIKYNKKLASLFKIYLLNNKDKTKIQSQIHLDYLTSRGITLEDIIDFEIGFCPMSALETIYKNTDDNKFKQYLISSGLVSTGFKGQVNEFFKDRIMFPIKDSKGNILGFTGRTLDPRDAAKYKLSKESVHFTKGDLLYGFDTAKDAINKTKEMFLLEGNFDVVASHQLGLKNAVGLNGCSISQKQIQTIKKTKAKVYIALDNDNAGHAGAIKVAEQLSKEGVPTAIIDIAEFGNYKDNGDILQASLENKEIKKDFVAKFKSSAKNSFEMKLKYDIFADKLFNFDTILAEYEKLKDNLSPAQDVMYKHFVTKNSDFSRDDIDAILSSKKVQENSMYADLGRAILAPYLDNPVHNLSEDQKQIVTSKILGNIDNVLTFHQDNFSFDKILVDSYIKETVANSKEKHYKTELKNENNGREKAKEISIFTLEGFQNIHKDLFKNNSLAGVLRTRECNSEYYAKSNEVEAQFNKICAGIQKYEEKYLNQPFSNRINFLARVSNAIIKLNAFEMKSIGRIEKLFIEKTAERLNIPLDYNNYDKLIIAGFTDAIKDIMENNQDTSKFIYLYNKVCLDNSNNKEPPNKNERFLTEPQEERNERY